MSCIAIRPGIIRWSLPAILLWIGSQLFIDSVSAKTLYHYQDDGGVNVITDQYEHIPLQYRSHVSVRVIQQEGESEVSLGSMSKWTKATLGSLGKASIGVPGLSPHQSQILTYAGLIALVCILAMYLSRSQWIRFLALWCLILLAIATPVLLYVFEDCPADIMRSKASQVKRLQSTQ